MAVMKFITENAPNCPYPTKYKDGEAVYDVIHYIFDPNKTDGYYGGWAVDPNHAGYEMELLTGLFRKNKGVRLRHWVISFSESELNKLEHQFEGDIMMALYTLGAVFSAYYRKEYQIVFAVHGGVRPHLHFVMNTVAYTDGKKFSGNRKDFYQYAKYAKSVAYKYGLILYVAEDHAATKCYHSWD